MAKRAPAENTESGSEESGEAKVSLVDAIEAAPEDEEATPRQSRQRFFFVVAKKDGSMALDYSETKQGALEKADALFGEDYEASETAEEFTSGEGHNRFLSIAGVVKPPKVASLAKRIKM